MVYRPRNLFGGEFVMLRTLYFSVIAVVAIVSGSAFANDTTDPSEAPSTSVAAVNETDTAAASATDATASDASSQPALQSAAVKPAPLPKPTLTVSIDLAQQRMTVSENGIGKYSWPISSGTASHPTPRGTFRPQWTAKIWNSRKYDWAPMPHSVFINGGIAVHGTQHVGALGRPASHGCIRLAPGNARTFYNLVHRHGLKKTKVAVHGTPKWSAPAIASRRKKPAAQYAAQNDSWFWGSPSYSAYNPNFVKKRARAPQVRAYRQRGSNRIVYMQQPPAYGGDW
jgi:lipoprotein-anchoring transpeptidase ErfK/SrfK